MHVSRPVTGLVIVVILAAACGAAGGPSAAPSVIDQSPGARVSPSALTAPAATPEPTERPLGSYEACDGAPGSIALTVRDQEADDGIGPVLDQLNREFQAANPGVQIVRHAVSRDDLERSIQSELARPDGPDVAQVGTGRTGIGSAVTAGLLLPLGEAEATYGWGERWAPRTLDRMRFNDDGSGFGSGTLYGVPVTGELVGLMFSDEVAHTRPVRPAPQTLAEDMADYAAIKGEGIAPIVVGAGDGDMLLVYGSILGSLVTPEWLDDFVYGRDGATFDTPETVEAARMLVEMGRQGFFAKGSESMSTADALRQFIANRAQFMATGSWTWPALKRTGAPFMFSRWNPQDVGGSALSVGGTGLPWAVRKTSGHPGCAAAYLDFITSDHAMELIAALELVLPSHISAGALGSDPSFRDMTFAYRDTESANQLGHYLDWALPSGPETFQAELARLLAEEITPTQFVKDIDAVYQASLAANP